MQGMKLLQSVSILGDILSTSVCVVGPQFYQVQIQHNRLPGNFGAFHESNCRCQENYQMVC